MRHIRQLFDYDCGAASFAMITGCSVPEAIKKCKTNKSGTCSHNVSSALAKEGFKNKIIYLSLPFESLFVHLKLLSKEYAIYVSGNFICNSGKGRDSHRHHAFVIKDETVFDPAQKHKLDIFSVGHLYNRALIIERVILVGID